MFLTLRDDQDVKRTQYPFFREIEDCEKNKSTRDATRQNIRAHHAVQDPGRMVGPIFHLVGQITANFGSTDSSGPKPTI
jgi:hypothetical protein